jgi:hypothetical protein
LGLSSSHLSHMAYGRLEEPRLESERYFSMFLGGVLRMRRLLILFFVVSALAVASTASARVRPVSVTSPINHGGYATLTVAVSPAATCSITVFYKSGPSSGAGLYPKRGSRISWTWKVGTRTTPGRWPISVSCGSAGSLRTSFVVFESWNCCEMDPAVNKVTGTDRERCRQPDAARELVVRDVEHLS